ncbi:MAG: hypothetical protein K6B70_07530 [Clostridia bacterium]|nr:hypothetical protein [Clostridia bacterium]
MKSNHDVDPEYKYAPITRGETLEPCLRGGKKILNNPEIREMMHRIYTGTRKRTD